MRRRHYLAAALTLISAVLWAATLLTGSERWDVDAGAVLAAGLVVASVVSVVAMLVQSSRFGYWLAWGLAAIEAVVAVVTPISSWWTLGILSIACLGLVLTDRTLGGWIGQLPNATPVPRQAVALCTVLLGAGPLSALVSVGTGVGPLPVLTAGSWIILFWYVRRWPGREWMPRLLTPVLATAGLLLPVPARLMWIPLLGAATVLAWTAPVRLAVRPIVERGNPVPIPPELAPPDVLHSAGVDEHGRRLTKKIDPTSR